MMKKKIIAVPMGDAAGIGPEIVVKALCSGQLVEQAKCVVIGVPGVFERAIKVTGVDLKLNVIQKIEEAVEGEGVLNLIPIAGETLENLKWGEINADCGRAAYKAIEMAVKLAMEDKVSAVATTPINKESLRAAQIPFIGHTEIFGALTGVEDPLTLFETNGLRVFFLTRHVSLRAMLDMIKKERIIDYVKRCQDVLGKLGITEGVMAVAGLNPHCGEHGLFGTEEMEEIIPAIEELQKNGYQVEGPIGADSVFHQAAIGKYNSVVSLYHDQGHIATKTLDFARTISITAGMPVLRTSVDHGTAFDIAGTGKADETSMVEAINLAVKYSEFYKEV